MELAQAVESLFSNLTTTDDVSLNGITGDFVQIHQDHTAPTKKKNIAVTKDLGKDPQSVDHMRIQCLEYLLSHVDHKQHIFNIHSSFDGNKRFSQKTIEILISFIKNMTPGAENEEYHGKAHLVGLVATALSKIIIANINQAYDSQAMSTDESMKLETDPLSTAAKQKTFLSVCRKSLTTIVAYAAYEVNRLSNVKSNKVIHDNSTACACVISARDLIITFSERDIRLPNDAFETIKSFCKLGMFKCSHWITSKTCATIFSVLVQNEEKHSALMSELIEQLQFLLAQCYNLIPEEHDPRKLYLKAADTSNANKEKEQLDHLRVCESLMISKDTHTFSSQDYEHKFKVISHALLTCMSHQYGFPIVIDTRKVFDLIHEACALSSTIHVTNSNYTGPNRIMLKAETYPEIMPTIHYQSLAILSTLILRCTTQLAPLANSIMILLAHQLKRWAHLGDSSDQASYSILEQCIKASKYLIRVFGPCCHVILCHPLIPHLVEQLNLYHFSCIKLLTASDDMKQAQHSLRDYNVTGKKKKRSKTSHSQQQQTLISIDNWNQYVLLLLDFAQSITNDGNISLITNVDDPVTSHLIDLQSVLISSITLWLEQYDHLHTKYHPSTTPVICNMYRVLQSTLQSTSGVDTQSPYLPHIVDLYKRGIASNVTSLSAECRIALNIVNCYLHPQSAPLYIPPAESIKANVLMNMEKIEKVNRVLMGQPITSSHDDNNEDDHDQEMKENNGPEVMVAQSTILTQSDVQIAPVVTDQQQAVEPVQATVITTVQKIIPQENNQVKQELSSPPIEQPSQPVKSAVVDCEVIVVEDDPPVQSAPVLLSSDEIKKAFEMTKSMEGGVDGGEKDDDIEVVDEDDDFMNRQIDLNDLDLQF
ncbi:hypothetical protein AKO1_001773 [Acrasis kona]|uniref:Uncharacterized protein n=1 Tax=Acrasis kona TaxID=1008807 RepID=A0AAW2Z9H9_9EUKA